jgi:rod shape-determining protein MreC
MLLVDAAHAVPVQVNRNDIRSIAAGTGRMDRLELEYVPITADIREGDLLVSSGLGGHFPRGYPVGKVVSVIVDPTQPYAQVVARPLAALDRSRHVLLVYEPTAPETNTPEPAAAETKAEESKVSDAKTKAPAPKAGSGAQQ